MITNQTIDGVPRVDLESICEDFEAGRHWQAVQGVQKLRALLDLPVPLADRPQFRQPTHVGTFGGQPQNEPSLEGGCDVNNPEWSGIGLPPVGLQVEAWYTLDTLPGGKPFKLKYFSKESVVFEGMHETYVSRGTFDRWDLRFRPILPVRTPEQPAPVALTDEQILEAMRPAIYAADGGYVFDTAPEHVIAAGRALIAYLDELKRLNQSISEKE